MLIVNLNESFKLVKEKIQNKQHVNMKTTVLLFRKNV